MEHVEIERKFLVSSLSDIWETQAIPGAESGTVISQGYLVATSDRTLRVRITNDQATLTLKGPRYESVRIEYEESLSLDFGMSLLHLAEPLTVSKIRYPVVAEDQIWIVDVFQDKNRGLIIAEIELERTDQKIAIPHWCSSDPSLTGVLRLCWSERRVGLVFPLHRAVGVRGVSGFGLCPRCVWGCGWR